MGYRLPGVLERFPRVWCWYFDGMWLVIVMDLFVHVSDDLFVHVTIEPWSCQALEQSKGGRGAVLPWAIEMSPSFRLYNEVWGEGTCLGFRHPESKAGSRCRTTGFNCSPNFARLEGGRTMVGGGGFGCLGVEGCDWRLRLAAFSASCPRQGR